MLPMGDPHLLRRCAQPFGPRSTVAERPAIFAELPEAALRSLPRMGELENP